MTLMAFLEARVAEDELIAHAAIEGSADWYALYTYRDVKDGDGRYVVLADTRYPTAEQAAHVARHSPARVLRHCQAARAVIAQFLSLDALGETSSRDAAEEALRRLASIYSDHADFDQTWV